MFLDIIINLIVAMITVILTIIVSKYYQRKSSKELKKDKEELLKQLNDARNNNVKLIYKPWYKPIFPRFLNDNILNNNNIKKFCILSKKTDIKINQETHENLMNSIEKEYDVIKTLSTASFEFINTGFSVINGNDCSPKLGICIDNEENGYILNLIHEEPEYVGLSYSLSNCRKVVTIDFNYLDPNDSFKVELLTSVAAPGKNKIKLIGKVKGLKVIEEAPYAQ